MIAARVLAVGAVCALVHNAIMIAGDRLGLHYAASLVVSFVVVVVIGYSLHSRWTYRLAVRGAAAFWRYVVVASANFPASLVGMFVFVDLAGLSVPIASPIVTVLLFLMNYAGNKWALRAKA